jgi:hypothetical protein
MDLHSHVFFQLAGGSVTMRKQVSMLCEVPLGIFLVYLYFVCVWHLVQLMWKCVSEPDNSASCFLFLLYESQKGT